MRLVVPAVCLWLVALAVTAFASAEPTSIAGLQRALERNPYDCASRRLLVHRLRTQGDHGSAYYHAAWLSWLGARQYAEGDAGWLLLRDRAARDRAARIARGGAVAAILAAVAAEQDLFDSCLRGTVGRQTKRLCSRTADLLARAERAEAETGRHDPVVRMGLARLAMTMDDVMMLLEDEQAKRQRASALRTAASRAAAAAAWLPEAPGPHRLLARVRARQAQLGGDSELWRMAIEEAERTYALDCKDSSLAELLWVLNLRAGCWEEAGRWERELARAGACALD